VGIYFSRIYLFCGNKVIFQETLSAPVLVHCSAGVGRSGAYILMETLIGLMEAETPIRVIDIVQNLREQRMAMVGVFCWISKRHYLGIFKIQLLSIFP
jgi:protein tyrosine phosphatase